MNQRLIVMLLLLAASGLAVSETDISEPPSVAAPLTETEPSAEQRAVSE